MKEFYSKKSAMPIVLNKLMALYGRLSALLLLVHAGSCKNETASKHIDLMLEKKEQTPYSTSNTLEIDQKGDVTASESNSERPTAHAVQMERNHPHENSKDHLKQTHDREPSFTLKEITIQAGTEQSTMLEAAGTTEGYIIKSISIDQNGCYHTSKFGANTLKNKPIPPTGLPITLTTDPNLKTGTYVLQIKIGKIGKGSQKTEKLVKCKIHVIEIEDELKNKKQNNISSTKRTIQALNSEAIDQNDGPIKTAPHTSENIEAYSTQNHTTPTEPSFTLKNVTLAAGSAQPIRLEAAGITEGYVIQAISIKKNKKYYTPQLGLHALKGKPIPSSGLAFNLTETHILKPGQYSLTITVRKTEGNTKKNQ